MQNAGFLRKIVLKIDERFQKKEGLRPIPGTKHSLLMVCFHDYRGEKPVTTNDQVIIAPGDPVGELHFDNKRIMEIAAVPSERPLEWRLLEILKAEFTALADAVAAGKLPGPVKGFFGVNVLTVGAKRLGFTLIPLPRGWKRWWLGFWESLLRIVFYSYKTKGKTSLRKTMDPREVWISSAELARRYSKRDEQG